MNESNIKQFSYLIEQQFPAIYRKEGENLVKFIEAYYEWLEQEGMLTNQTMSLPEYLDIDATLDQFLSHFRETYMVGLPASLIGNQRLLQKHILDLYRSKNSKTSIELLFRLLYNTAVEVYLPSDDILRTSDGKFERRSYLEVDYSVDFNNFIGKTIRGSISNALAVVSATERRLVKGVPRVIMYIEDIRGTFQVSENIYYNETRDHDPVRILGSVTGFDVTMSVAGWEIGEEVYIQEELSPTMGEGVSAYVSEVYNSDTGMIFPIVVDGGTGYAMDSIVTITDNENTQGSGAEFTVGALKDTMVLPVTDYTVSDFMGVTIGAPDYSVHGIGTSNGYTANSAADMDLVLEYIPLTIGTITEMRIINPGADYDGKVQITVNEPRIERLNRPDLYSGNNAIIDNYAAFGDNLASRITVRQSGVGYQGTGFTYVRDAGNIKFAGGVPTYGPVGKSEGRYVSEDGFLSSTKKLQDSFYYQSFSYEIRAAQSLRQYGDIVRAVCHPSGNELFGSVKAVDINRLALTPQETISIT